MQVTLKELQEHKVVGNHHHDSELFKKIDHFVLQEGVSRDEQREALVVLDQR